jgi:cytidylate kinase
MKDIIIAIDGFSSTGKSTLAKQLAQRLGYTYIDSGAMYRAITLYFIRHNIVLHNQEEVLLALKRIELHFDENGICLNNEPVDAAIRTMEVSGKVSEVSAIEAVRKFAVAQQQKMGVHKKMVMDGRDIGTVVFPDAALKIYLTADPEVRTQRRYDELKIKSPEISRQEVQANLAHRDHLDSTRAFDPLRKADDARELNNSGLSMQEQLDIAEDWALQLIQQS